MIFIILGLIALLTYIGTKLIKLKSKTIYRTTKKDTAQHKFRSRRKEQWVINKIIYFKSIMPKAGCRTVAACFNRQFSHQETVSKSWVCNIIKKHQYEITIQRRKIKNRQPKSMPINRTWGIDLTGKHNSEGKNTHIMGIIDHGSRANLLLKALHSKASIQLLRCLLDSIEKYGKPHAIRTDNEAVFTSRLFRFGLWFLSIKHQTIDLHCPWQNGCIERLFGTLKNVLNHITIQNQDHLNWHLQSFRFYYNHVRTHQNLNNQTPAEIWSNKPHKCNAVFFSAWDESLTGFWHPPN